MDQSNSSYLNRWCATTSGLFVLCALVFFAAGDRVSAGASGADITILPRSLDSSCRNGRAKLYDECGDQKKLFQAARRVAREEGKVLLVSYGAEWCIWCHVFAAYVHGGKSKFSYTYGTADEPDLRERITMYERESQDVSAEADALRAYVAKSFVIVHIDGQYAPGSDVVLERTGGLPHYDYGIPFIYSVDAEGRYAAHLISDRVETRRDGWWNLFRGYSRERLKEHLAELHAAAKR